MIAAGRLGPARNKHGGLCLPALLSSFCRPGGSDTLDMKSSLTEQWRFLAPEPDGVRAAPSGVRVPGWPLSRREPPQPPPPPRPVSGQHCPWLLKVAGCLSAPEERRPNGNECWGGVGGLSLRGGDQRNAEEVAGQAPRILRSFPCPVPDLPKQARARRHRAALCPVVVIASQFLSQLPPHPTSRPLDSACRFPGPYLAALWRGFARIWERGLRKEERIGKKKKKKNRCWEEVGIRLRHFLAQLPHLGSGAPASRVSQLGPAGTREKGFSSRHVQGRTVKICLGWPIFSFAPIKRKSPRNSIKATLAKALFEA